MSWVGDARPIVPSADVPRAGALAEPAALAAPPETAINVAEAWRIMTRRKLLILVSFIVLYALIIAATFITWRWFPAYESMALLELRPPPEKAYDISDPLVDAKIMASLVQTEAQKINRLDVLQEVLKLPEIQQTSFFRWYDDFDDCLYDLKDLLRAVPIPDSRLIDVSLSIRDPEECRLIVATIVDRYLARYRADAAQAGRQSAEEMRNTKAQLIKDLDDKQRELEEFRQRRDVGALESEMQVLVVSIADQKRVFSEYDLLAADLQAQLNVIESYQPGDLPVSPEDRVIIESDPLLRLYRQQVEAMDIELETWEQHLAGKDSRQYKLMKTRRDALAEREVARREELLDDLRARRVDALRQELARTRSIQARGQDSMETLQARLADLSAHRVKYERILADQARLHKALETVEDKAIEFQHVLRATPQQARLVQIQAARKAYDPSRPNLKVWLIGGVFVALLGAIGVAFLRELTDKAVRTPIDVARHGRLSVLGVIPQLGDEQADLEQIELATRSAPHSLVSEAFRQVRANLVFSGPVETQRVLLIASPGPGNGKTAVAINLAVTLAQASQRVLLVDGNFRRPAIRTAFRGTRAEGLSNILIGQGRLEELVTATDVPNLDVLTSGPMPPTPAELLGSAYMRQMIEQAKAKYDRVIFDGPPVLLISDALVLATQVDGVILVARAVDNTKGVLRRAREQLEKINAHVVGAILNGVQARAGGYYRQQYRQFYDYSYAADETIPPELPEIPAPRDEES